MGRKKTKDRSEAYEEMLEQQHMMKMLEHEQQMLAEQAKINEKLRQQEIDALLDLLPEGTIDTIIPIEYEPEPKEEIFVPPKDHMNNTEYQRHVRERQAEKDDRARRRAEEEARHTTEQLRLALEKANIEVEVPEAEKVVIELPEMIDFIPPPRSKNAKPREEKTNPDNYNNDPLKNNNNRNNSNYPTFWTNLSHDEQLYVSAGVVLLSLMILLKK